MRKFVLATAALLYTSSAFAYTTTPFNLAFQGYQGTYKDEILENGNRLGSAGLFCHNARLDRSDVANTLFAAADEKGIVDGVDEESFIGHLEDLVYDICRNN